MPCESPLVCFKAGRFVFFSIPSAVSRGFSPGELEPFQVRCGQCLDCKIQRSRVWSARCVAEASQSADNCFLTLTYNDLSLPVLSTRKASNDLACVSSGVVGGLGGNCTPLPASEASTRDEVATLRLPDLQKFWKRLRNSGARFRYFACGEYGSRTLRPHYHAIVFGWSPDDLAFDYIETENGLSRVARSPFLDKVWNLGHVSVGQVSSASCAYVARYCTKKLAPRELGERDREFIVMSRRPAIGSQFMRENKSSVLEYDAIFDGKKWSKPPRVFENFLSRSEFESLKERRVSKVQFLEPSERRRKFAFVKEIWRKNSRCF